MKSEVQILLFYLVLHFYVVWGRSNAKCKDQMHNEVFHAQRQYLPIVFFLPHFKLPSFLIFFSFTFFSLLSCHTFPFCYCSRNSSTLLQLITPALMLHACSLNDDGHSCIVLMHLQSKKFNLNSQFPHQC